MSPILMIGVTEVKTIQAVSVRPVATLSNGPAIEITTPDGEYLQVTLSSRKLVRLGRAISGFVYTNRASLFRPQDN